MRSKLLKRLLVLVLSGAMVFGTCGAALGSVTDTAAAGTDTVSEDTTADETDTASEEAAAAATDEADTASEDTAAAVTDTVSEEAAAAASDEDTVAAADVSSEDFTYDEDETTILLSSADDLINFSAYVADGNTTADARVTGDIDLTDAEGFYPIGLTAIAMTTTAPTLYAGTFDGGGYTITLALDYSDSTSYYLALFAGLTEGGTIQDLNVAGTVSGTARCAGVAAYSTGGTIEDVESSVSVTASSGYASGFVAYQTGSGSLYITDCTNKGTITSGSTYCAGILCDLYGTSSSKPAAYITGCVNEGTINGGNYCAGIIGYDNGKSTSQILKIIGCINTGDVTSSGSYVAGIAAYSVSGNSATSTYHANAYIGGCVNTGTISSTGTSAGRVGGIAGYAYADMQYCFNLGEVSIAATSAATATYYTGGIIGCSYRYETIDACYNAGTVDAVTGGGIVGRTYSSTSSSYADTVQNCYNTAAVGNDSATYGGGIIEYGTAYNYVENCYNTGTVTAETYCGALLGYYTADMDLFTNSYALTDSASYLYGNTSYSLTSGSVDFIDSDTLKTYAATLGDAYKADTNDLNDGYPILTYQGLSLTEVEALYAALDDTSDDYEEELAYYYAALYSYEELTEEQQESLDSSAAADKLTVTKTVAETDMQGYALDADLVSEISDKEYTFALYKADSEDTDNGTAQAGITYVVTDTDGNNVDSGTTGEDGSFTLKDGQTATFSSIASGTAIDMDTEGYYYVTESSDDAYYLASWEQSSSAAGSSETSSSYTSGFAKVDGDSSATETVSFTCTNTYVQDVVSVEKVISEYDASGNALSSTSYSELVGGTYTFTLYDADDNPVSGAYYSVFDADDALSGTYTTGDDGTFTISGSSTARFFGLDLSGGASYYAVESISEDIWGTSWSGSSSESEDEETAGGTTSPIVTVTGGSATAAETISLVCTNTYSSAPDVIAVTKEIADTAGDGGTFSTAMLNYLTGREYSFALYINDEVVSGLNYNIYDADGNSEGSGTTDENGIFTITGGQTAKFENADLNDETTCYIVEQDLSESEWSAAWTASSDADSASVADGSGFTSNTVSLTGDAATSEEISFTCTNTYANTAMLIADLDDLVEFAELVGYGYYPDALVTADIDATGTTTAGESFEPIGGGLSSSDTPVCYAATFDGDGHTITLSLSSETDYTALFAGLGEGGTICNLNVAGTVSSSASYTAGVAAYLTGGTIENVTSDVYVEVNTPSSSTTLTYTAGIAACCSADVTITACVNTGEIDGSGNYIGGIAGWGYGSVTDCTNEGDISGSLRIGGIVGYMAATDDIIESCMNYGDVSGRYHVGGIAAYFNGASLQYCGNEGAVTESYSIGSTYAAGGVVGYVYNTGAVIDSCYNKGTVSGPSIGGIAGFVAGSSSAGPTLTNCYNTGSFSPTSTSGGTSGGGSGYVGGIMSYGYAGMTIQNCYNCGSVVEDTEEDDSQDQMGGMGDQTTACSLFGYLSGSSSTTISNNYGLVADSMQLVNTGMTYDDTQLAETDAYTLKTYANADDEGDSVLGDAYKEDITYINSHYPILSWEDDAEAIVLQKDISASTETLTELLADENTFDFTLYQADTEGSSEAVANISYRVYDANYDLVSTSDADGNEVTVYTSEDGTIEGIADGQTVVVDGTYSDGDTETAAFDLSDAEVSYYVQETLEEDTIWVPTWVSYKGSSNAANAVNASGSSSAAVAAADAEDGHEEICIICTNTYAPSEVTGNMSISETVYTTDDEDTTAFTFTLYQVESDESVSQVSSESVTYTIADSDGTTSSGDLSSGSLTLSDGQTASLSGLELNGTLSYYVVQTCEDDGWYTSYDLSLTSESGELFVSDNDAKRATSTMTVLNAEEGDTLAVACANIAMDAYDMELVLDYGLAVEIDPADYMQSTMGLGDELIGDDDVSYSLQVSADQETWDDSSAAGTYGTLTVADDAQSLTYTPTEELNGIETVYYKLTVSDGESESDSTSTTGTITLSPASSVYYEEDYGTDGITKIESSDDCGMVIFSTGARVWKTYTTTSTNTGIQEANYAGYDEDSVYGTDEAYAEDAYDSEGHVISVGYDSADDLDADDLYYYSTYGASLRYDFTGTGTTVYGRFLEDSALVKVQLYKYASEEATTAALVETKFLDTRNLAAYYNVDALDATLYGTPLFDTALLDEAGDDGSLDYGSYMLRIYVYPEGTTVNGMYDDQMTDYYYCDDSGTFFYLDGIRIDNPLGTDTDDSEDYEEAAKYYEADGESTASVVRIRDKVVGGEIDVSEGAFATLTDSDGDVTDTSDYESVGPKNELWLYTASGDDTEDEDTSDVDTVSFYILNWDEDADYKLYIGMRSPNPDDQATALAGGTSYSIASSADMYYDITDTVKTTTYNGTTVGLVTISASEGLLSLTRMKITGAEVSSESAVDEEGELTVSAASSAMLYLVPTTVEWLSEEDFTDSGSDTEDEATVIPEDSADGSDETITDDGSGDTDETVTDDGSDETDETVTDDGSDETDDTDETVTDETTGDSDETVTDDATGDSDETTGDADETDNSNDASASDNTTGTSAQTVTGSTSGESEGTAAAISASGKESADSSTEEASVAKVKASYSGGRTKLTITVSAAVTSLKAGGKQATLVRTKANGQKVYTVKLKGDKRGKAVKMTLKTSDGSNKVSVFLPKKLKSTAVRDASAKKTTITVKTSSEVKKLTVNGRKATGKKNGSGYVYTIKVNKTKKNASYSIIAYNKQGVASAPETVKK